MTALASAELLVEAPEPGSEEWLRYMSGSKIAAVMRLSPYESYYSLWFRMAGIVRPEGDSDVTRRGHYLEPGIAAWFTDQHPEYDVTPGGMWVSTQYPMYSISPDALLIHRETGEVVPGEWKSALDQDIWGEELSDEIPVYYRCQVMWGMGLLGLKRAKFCVLTSFLQFREFEVVFDQAEFDLLLAAADRFMASLVADEKPDIDSHRATYEVVKQLHPDIDPVKVEVPTELAVGYCNAKVAEKAAGDDARLWTARLADHMGNRKTATFAGKAIASRQSRGNGTPYVQAVRNLEPLPPSLIENTPMEEAS